MAALVWADPASAQDIGHRLPGTAGLDAGSQSAAGLRVVNRFVYYHATDLRDRDGDELPVGLELNAAAAIYGLSIAIELMPQLYFNAAISVPFVGIWQSTEEPRERHDSFGLADVAMQPVKLGWRGPPFDLVASYGASGPTRTFGDTPLVSSQWSQQFSIGGTAFFTRSRSWRASMLATYDVFHQKRRVDVTRGDTITLEGGVGTTLWRLVDAGVVGYALWQARGNRGDDLPAALRETRDRLFGLGAELAVALPPVRGRLGARWAHDLGARARPQGQILVINVAFLIGAPPFDASGSASATKPPR